MRQSVLVSVMAIETATNGEFRMAQMLGDVTKAVVARAIAISRAGTLADAELVNGDDEAGTSSVSLEEARGVASPVSEASSELSPQTRPALRNIKREPTHDPSALPPRRVGSRLVFTVIEGDRRAGGGGRSPVLRCSPRDRARELGWVLHQATPS